MITNQKRISLETVIAQSQGNIVSDVNGEKVMLSIRNGKYYNLGIVGGAIWEMIENQIPVHQLVQKLMFEYDVMQTECDDQVLSFLENLLDDELIQTS